MGVLRRDVVRVNCGGHDGDTAGDVGADLWLGDNEVGKGEGESTASGAADREKLRLVTTDG